MNNELSLSPNQLNASGESANILANWIGASIFVLAISHVVKKSNQTKLE